MIRSIDLITLLADLFRTPVAQIALMLAVAGCAASVTMWECDVTLSTVGGDRTASGSGSGSTQEEAERAALAVACPKLGLTGESLQACKAGRIGFGSGLLLNVDWHCEFSS